MKSKPPISIFTFLLSAFLLAFCFSLQAQTNQTPQSFFTTVESYFTAFNTNLFTFSTNHHADLYLGMDTIENTKIAASFNIDADVYKGFSAHAVVRNDTILGHVFSAQGGLAYSIINLDTKVSLGVDIGHRFDDNRTYAAPRIEVKKALTDNTFAGVGMELPIYFSGGGQSVVNPSFSVFTGFKF